MTHDEFVAWLDIDVRDGRLTAAQRQDLLDQKREFDAQRSDIERDHRGKVVGIVNGAMQIGDTVHEVFDQAEARDPDRMVYFEGVGFDVA